jgi:hypothetical protein
LLESVTNLNDPIDYKRALARAEPLVEVRSFTEQLSALALGLEPEELERPPVSVHAATLGGAARASGTHLDSAREPAINGRAVPPDPEEPLVYGDVVCLAFDKATP